MYKFILKITIALLTTTILFTGCGNSTDTKEQRLQALTDKELIVTGESVNFTTATKGEKYEWLSESGELISDEESFNRAFYQEGTFKTTLKVTNAQGVVTSTDVSIKVDRAPEEEVTANEFPVAKATISSAEICTGEGVTFSGSQSSDSDGTIVTYEWRDAYGVLLSNDITLDRGFPHAATYKKTLTVIDDKGATSSQTVELVVKVCIPNTAPTATAQSITLNEDTTKRITLAGTDAEDDDLTFTVVTLPRKGTFTNGIYRPRANYYGSDSFTFRANDGELDSTTAIVNITIRNVAEPIVVIPNRAPTATAQSVTMPEDTARTITLAGTDPDGNALTYAVVTNPTHGTFVNGVYTPTPNYNGIDSFTFRANDGRLNSAVATVNITITDVAEPNQAPTATAQSVTLSEDTTKAITLTGTDPDGDNLTYIVTTNPTNGAFVNGVYTPTANYNGSDSFSFTANDGSLTSAPSTVTIAVTAVNDAPTATSQTITILEDASTAIVLSGTDPDGDTLTYAIHTTPMPEEGTLSGRVYESYQNFNGTFSLSFRAYDGALYSGFETVTIIVTPVNDAPTATAQSVTLDEDTTKAITLAGTDPDGDNLTYTVTTNPAHGTFANGIYTPTPNYNGSDSFSFTANDGSLTSVLATVSITITDVAEPNQAPTATAQTVTLNEDTTKAITLAGTDPDGDALTYTVTTLPSHGAFANGVYTPTSNYHGSDNFSFTANDGLLTSTPAIVSITVNSVNDNPTVDAGVDTTITQGDSYTPNPTSSDIDGTIASTVWKEGATTLTFPKTDFTAGTHTLTVTVTDNEGLTAIDTLTLTVTANCTPLHKTGQTTTYHNNDDGDYQKGATRSYARDDANNIVTDNVTNLMWQDNESLRKKWVTQANYDAGNYSDTSGDTATTYCTNLALGGHNDWRLPTIEELYYLADTGRVNPAIDPVFQNQVSNVYWSSTTYANATSLAWFVDFYYGYDYAYHKDYDFYVRCVRAGQ